MKEVFKDFFKKSWVKWLCLILTVVMACGAIISLFPSEEVKEKTPAVRRIVLSDCENLDGWTAANASTVSLSDTIYRTGSHSIVLNLSSFKDTSGDNVTLRYVTENFIDISDMTHIGFDFYISVKENMPNGISFTFEIGSAKVIDVDELTGTFNMFNLKDGWNHIEFDLSVLREMGDCDLKNIRRFRIYDEGMPTVESKVTFAIDNIYFTNRPTGNTYS